MRRHLSKGGEYSPWYFGIHLVVDWEADGHSIRNLRDDRGREISRYRGADQFFIEGLTYPFRTVKGFNARVMPKDCLFTIQGPSIISKGPDKTLALAFLNSLVCRVYLESLTSFGAWQVGYLQLVPYFEPEGNAQQKVTESVSRILALLMQRDLSDETSPLFAGLELIEEKGIKDTASHLSRQRATVQREIEQLEQSIQEEYSKLVGLHLNDLQELCSIQGAVGKRTKQ